MSPKLEQTARLSIMAYISRLVERTLDDLLLIMGGVAIEGPMGAGKSELCRQRARRVVQLDVDANSRALVEMEPSALLTGPYPTLFDEWQTEHLESGIKFVAT